MGRHSTFALLNDRQTILAYGDKNANIDGFMSLNISHDRGRSWQVFKSPVSRLGGGQRASLIRLSSGRRFLLDGTEIWYYQSGRKQWQIGYRAGRKVGTETYWSEAGERMWEKVYQNDGAHSWMLWDENGKLRPGRGGGRNGLSAISLAGFRSWYG